MKPFLLTIKVEMFGEIYFQEEKNKRNSTTLISLNIN